MLDYWQICCSWDLQLDLRNHPLYAPARWSCHWLLQSWFWEVLCVDVIGVLSKGQQADLVCGHDGHGVYPFALCQEQNASQSECASSLNVGLDWNSSVLLPNYHIKALERLKGRSWVQQRVLGAIMFLMQRLQVLYIQLQLMIVRQPVVFLNYKKWD